MNMCKFVYIYLFISTTAIATFCESVNSVPIYNPKATLTSSAIYILPAYSTVNKNVN